jgi:cell division protein FtsA
MAKGRNIAVGIDVGTHQVKVIVAEKDSQKGQEYAGDSLPRIIGSGLAESRGIRHGFVTNLSDAAKSIRQAVSVAEKSAGVSIKKAYISIGGVGLSAIISVGTVVVTKADNEITDLDVKRAIEESEKELPNAYIQNRKIIHTIPLEYRIDGKRVLGRPQGLKGVKLEARVLYITSLAHHLSDIMLALEEADIEIIDVTASPMAASLVTLTKTQKIAGCVLANIGAETTSIMVFENNIPVSMEIFQIGSNDITNDLALGLKVSIEDAELIKLGQGKHGEFSKRKIEEIVVARLSDIFDLIEDHLRKIDRSGLLPAGIILTGGGSGIPNIEDLSRIALRLPSKQSHLKIEGNTKTIFRDFEWSVAYGLVILGLTNEDDDSIGMGLGRRWLNKTRQSLWTWIKQFLP